MSSMRGRMNIDIRNAEFEIQWSDVRRPSAIQAYTPGSRPFGTPVTGEVPQSCGSPNCIYGQRPSTTPPPVTTPQGAQPSSAELSKRIQFDPVPPRSRYSSDINSQNVPVYYQDSNSPNITFRSSVDSNGIPETNERLPSQPPVHNSLMNRPPTPYHSFASSAPTDSRPGSITQPSPDSVVPPTTPTNTPIPSSQGFKPTPSTQNDRGRTSMSTPETRTLESTDLQTPPTVQKKLHFDNLADSGTSACSGDTLKEIRIVARGNERVCLARIEETLRAIMADFENFDISIGPVINTETSASSAGSNRSQTTPPSAPPCTGSGCSGTPGGRGNYYI